MNEFENLDIDDVPLMERLKHKIKLHDAVRQVWKTLSAEKQTYPKSYARMMQRTFLKDVKKGLKIINKKNKVYIEMPNLEEVGNGMIKRVYENIDEEEHENPIEVNLPDIAIENIKKCGAIEEKTRHS